MIVDPTLEILLEARGLVARGWTQGSFAGPLRHGHQTYCAEGAIRAQIPVVDNIQNAVAEDEAVDLLMTAFRALYPKALDAMDTHDGLHLAYWNDAPERTQGEVVELYTKAITLAESRR